jgi:hypothetical protein
MEVTLRKIAREEPDVFHFVERLLAIRIRSGHWTAARELGRLWWRVHRRRSGEETQG